MVIGHRGLRSWSGALLWGAGRLLGALHESAQLVEAPPPGRADAADLHPEGGGDIGVRGRRVRHQDAEQPLAELVEPGERPPQLGVALAAQQGLVGCRAVVSQVWQLGGRLGVPASALATASAC